MSSARGAGQCCRCRDVSDHEAVSGGELKFVVSRSMLPGDLAHVRENATRSDAFQEHGGPVKRRTGMDERRSQRLDDAARDPAECRPNDRARCPGSGWPDRQSVTEAPLARPRRALDDGCQRQCGVPQPRAPPPRAP